MSNFLRPEEINHPRKRISLTEDFIVRKRRTKAWFRAINFYQADLLADTRLHYLLFKYSNRSNTWKVWLLAAFSMYMGSLLHYLNYKINVQEPKWVEDYG